jgi:hypothetical protein
MVTTEGSTNHKLWSEMEKLGGLERRHELPFPIEMSLGLVYRITEHGQTPVSAPFAKLREATTRNRQEINQRMADINNSFCLSFVA